MVRATWWTRVRRVNPLVWDGLLAALLLVITGASLPSGAAMGTAAGWVLAAVVCVPLTFRRRVPLPVLVVVAAGTVALAVGGDGVAPQAPLALATYSAAAHRPWRQVVTIALPVSVVAALAALLRSQTHGNWVEVLVGLTALVGFPILLGRIVWNRRERLARDREVAAREAVTEERTRIARELHDIVAHAMSVMVVQAGAARTVVDRDPAAAREAIARVEETGRAGLAEMRRLIGVLTEDGDAPMAPQPGLEQLEALVATMRDAGVPVEVVRAGITRPLPAAADLAAYRVIQESLTNVLKHAGPASARVVLTYRPDRLAIDVEDDGRGSAHTSPFGHGLIGMRERVASVGGTVEAAGRPGGGYAVHAELPAGSAP